MAAEPEGAEEARDLSFSSASSFLEEKPRTVVVFGGSYALVLLQRLTEAVCCPLTLLYILLVSPVYTVCTDAAGGALFSLTKKKVGFSCVLHP